MPIPAVIPGIITGAEALLPKLFSLFGAPPRGEYQKFLREAYPLMVKQANSRKTSTAIFWFKGEVIIVKPDGSYGVSAEGLTSVEAYTRFLEDFGKKQNIYGLYCRDTLVDCRWQFFGRAVSDVPVDPGDGRIVKSEIFGIGLAGIILLMVAGAVVYFISK
jgi:hypothetical protein